MSRYLTPSKIGLLALISLYAESLVPSAATIPILSFLVAHLLPVHSRASQNPSSENSHGFTLPIAALQQATITQTSVIPGRTLWDLLLNKLWEINSFDALHVFFDTTSLLLEKPREEQDTEESNASRSRRTLLSRSSPLGAFVRRSQLEFTRLQFHDGITLWKSFITYRSPTIKAWRRRHPGKSASIDANLDKILDKEPVVSEELISRVIYGDIANSSLNDANISTEDLEKLLEYQVEQMQSMFLSL